MNWQTVQYLTPYIVSLAISFAVGLYAWYQRRVTGAAAFAFVAWGQALWTFGYIFELANSTVAGKVLWDGFQYIGAVIWPVALLTFALQYTDRYLAHLYRIVSLAALPFALFLVLVATNHFHHLVQTGETLIPGLPFGELRYNFTPVVWLIFYWFLAVELSSLGLLIARYIRPHRLYRTQMGVIILGTLIPLIGVTFTINDVAFTFHRDTTPITFAISNLCIAWGFFHYRLLDIVPIARDRIFENMVDAVVVLDSQDRVIDLNPVAARTIGAPLHVLIGQPAEDVFAQWPDLWERFGDVGQMQTEVQAKTGGQQGWFDLQINPLRDRHGQPQGQLIVARDITAHKQIEAELRAANEKLQSLSRVKDEFVSNVSHELNSPITSIKLYLSLLEKKQDPSREASVASMRREVARLEDLIGGLLLLSRLDQDRVNLKPGQLDLNELVGQYVSDRLLLANSRGLSLEFQPAANLESVTGDGRLVGQVVSILLTNALNYTPAGGQVVVRTQAQLQDGQQWYGFCVQDTGPGIPADEISHLFDRFFRGEVGQTSGVSGTGLGLAIAQEIIQRHQGKIEVASNEAPDSGALFSVWLPVTH